MRRRCPRRSCPSTSRRRWPIWVQRHSPRRTSSMGCRTRIRPPGLEPRPGAIPGLGPDGGRARDAGRGGGRRASGGPDGTRASGRRRIRHVRGRHPGLRSTRPGRGRRSVDDHARRGRARRAVVAVDVRILERTARRPPHGAGDGAAGNGAAPKPLTGPGHGSAARPGRGPDRAAFRSGVAPSQARPEDRTKCCHVQHLDLPVAVAGYNAAPDITGVLQMVDKRKARGREAPGLVRCSMDQ